MSQNKKFSVYLSRKEKVMNKNQITEYLKRHPFSSKNEIREGIDFQGSDATLKRYLQSGMAGGAILADGAGRATKYYAAPEAPADRKYPDGIQTFEKIIGEGYLYVDKTALMWKLANCGSQNIFLSRPRRFGKSLLISTLKAYFEGRKELFNGLAIQSLENKWEPYPVIRLDLSTASDANDERQLYLKLGSILSENEEIFELPHEETLPGERLYRLVKRVYAKTCKPVVLLIDEYDAPLLSVLFNEEKEERYKSIIKEFFSPIKKLDPCLRFTFLSGVTKFSQLSIFSALNNLRDISMEDEYASLCGFTEEEMHTVFKQDILSLSIHAYQSQESIATKLKQRYDGYHFSPAGENVYNPYSILRVFSSRRMEDYWYSSGTPTVLVETLKRFNTDLYEIDGVEVTPSVFNQPTESVTNAVSLFYQSGYLTIKEYHPEYDSYVLSIPNAEVRAGLMDNLLPIMLKKDRIESQNVAIRFKKALVGGDVASAMEVLKAFFASIPYPEFGQENFDTIAKKEAYYQRLFYVVFSFMNIQIYTEIMNSEGRTDAIMYLRNAVYIVEAKVDAMTAQDAIRQIDKKGYTTRFKGSGLHIKKIGINFSSRSGTIGDWILEEEE